MTLRVFMVPGGGDLDIVQTFSTLDSAMKTIGLLTLAAVMIGAPTAQATQIVVGQVGPMSGLEATQGRAYAAGMQLLFNSVNKTGGVNGHTFKLVRKDDGGNAEDTLAATRALLSEDKPTVLAGYFGNRNLSDLVSSGVLEKERVALVGYRTTDLRGETPLLYNARASLRDEIGKITQHLATIGITRLGLLYEEGMGSAPLVAAVEEASRKALASLTSKASYPAGSASVSPAVDIFLKSNPQAIIMVSGGAASAAFIEKYRAAGGAAQLLAHSGTDIEQLSKRLGEEQMQGVAIAQVTPNPYKVSGRLVKEFSDAVAKTPQMEVPVSYAMMEGYITAKVITEAIRRQGSSKVTREGTIAALDSMDSYDMGGYFVSFKPGMRSGSKFVELSIITVSGKIRQ
jgi:branched-chain amino acid transport system substrate-binding protein